MLLKSLEHLKRFKPPSSVWTDRPWCQVALDGLNVKTRSFFDNVRVKILHGRIGACAYNVQVVLVPGWHMYSINQSGLIRPSLLHGCAFISYVHQR